ncbi:unnamed protein product [Ectocarpus sp. CCAP 1310/34]|nr:unnamed protein product [Ectocarpus sp. CCAP 1310/34]
MDTKKKRGRPPKRGRFKGKFQSHEPAVAAPEPLDDSTSSPMEVVDEPHDDHDEAWCDEDAGAASGGSQATLSFGSAAALGESPAACAALSWVREVAPPRRAEGPCRQTLSRRRQVALGAAKRQMASYMAGWLTRGAEQQSQQSLPQSSETQRAAEPLLEEDDSSAVPAAACTAEPGSDGGRDSNSDSCSETDMLVEDGVDLPLQEWVGEGEQAEAQGAVEEHCDDGYFSCGGFLDGHDYPSDRSDGSLDSDRDSDQDSDAGRDGDVEPRGSSAAAAMGNRREQGDCGFGGDVELGGASGAPAIGGCSAAAKTAAAATTRQPATAVRRSSRETSRKEYFPPRRASADRVGGSGSGRGVRKLLRDEVQNPLLRLKRETAKAKRVHRKARVRLVGQLWTKQQLARQARRTRKHCSERKEELVRIFRQALDKIDQAGNDYTSLVEKPDTMLARVRAVRVCRVIGAVRTYLTMEINEGVKKLAHSRAVGEAVGVHARTVRKWVTDFCKDGKFVVPHREYVKRQPFCYIDDEDIREQCREYVDERIYRRKKGQPRFRVADFQRWVNTVCLKEEFAGGGGICRSTAHVWIAQLGFRWRRHGKCVYVDGHNRPDVVQARRLYTEKMFVMRRLMSIPEKVETVVMVKVRDARDREKTSTDDRRDDNITAAVACAEPVLWPAVRTMPDGGVDFKHVLVYGDKFTEATGHDRCCTRVSVDAGDLEMTGRGGHYTLVPDREVQECYKAERVKEEALFWPAKRVVAGKEEYKHVRVRDGEQLRGRNCKRVGEFNWISADCDCHDCKRTPFVDSSRVPFNRRDLSASDGQGDFCLLPDHEVLALYFHDETTAKENDDGGCQWMDGQKGAAIKKKGEGRAVHVSDIIGVDRGVAVIGKEAWGMMQEDKSVGYAPAVEVIAQGPATGDGDVPECFVVRQRYERSGIYFGRKEGDGEDGHAVKFVQDAVELLKAMPADCGVTKTKNDPRTGAVIMTVGQNSDGYWTNDRMCKQIPGLIAIHELTSEPHRPMVMVFDNSTGHAAYEEGALVASHIQKKPGGGQVILDDFLDDQGNLVHATFREGDTVLFDTHVYAAKTPEQLEEEEREAAKKDPKYKRPKFGSSLGDFKAGEKVRTTGRTSGLIGQAKGGQQLLMEMGLWDVPGQAPIRVLECKACKEERKAIKAAITAFNRGGEARQQALDDAAREDQDGGGDGASPEEGTEGGAAGNRVGMRRRCCIRKVFAELKAFKMELNKIEKMFKKAGHICIFLAKYHPELNAIERYWGYVKHLLRLSCEYSLPHMLEILPGALSDVPLGFVRGWSRVTWLYLEAYDEGLVDYLEVRDLKKWLSHRSPTERGDSVVLARAGAGKTEEEKKKAEEKALAAAQELRTESIKRAKKNFKSFKQKRALLSLCEKRELRPRSRSPLTLKEAFRLLVRFLGK